MSSESSINIDWFILVIPLNVYVLRFLSTRRRDTVVFEKEVEQVQYQIEWPLANHFMITLLLTNILDKLRISFVCLEQNLISFKMIVMQDLLRREGQTAT